MEVIYLKNIYDIVNKLDNSSAIIGNFDGFHIGHQELLDRSRKSDLKSMIITFEGLNKAIGHLTSLNEKLWLFEQSKVDYVVVINYDGFREVKYNEFIDLLKRLNVKVITCGTDFKFGYNQEGNINHLKDNFVVEVDSKEVVASTTLIKEALVKHDLAEVKRMTNRDYSIDSFVIEGSKKGRELNFRTANINRNGYVVPGNGSYLVKVDVLGKTYYGMTNIGHNPTINFQEDIRIETHIFDFNEDIYGKEIKIYFLEFISEETKYNSFNELKEHLEDLKEVCKSLILKIN